MNILSEIDKSDRAMDRLTLLYLDAQPSTNAALLPRLSARGCVSGDLGFDLPLTVTQLFARERTQEL